MATEGSAEDVRGVVTGPLASELDSGWKEAQDFFFKQTGKNLFGCGSKEVGDVMAQLEKRYVVSETKDEKTKARAKTVALQVLTALSTLAKFAEPVVNAVYEPAGYCIKAAAYILDAPGKINDVYSGFSELFETIQGFLVQFKILHRTDQNTALPRELVENTHKLMMSFVRMCALCYKPIAGGKFAKFKIAIGAALIKYDSGINDELKNFEKLTKSQNNITHSVTLEHVLQMETGVQKANQSLIKINTDVSASREKISAMGEDVRYLVTDAYSRNRDDNAQAVLDELAGRLEGGVSINADTQHKLMDKLVDYKVPNSGSWLNEDTEAGSYYSRWMDFECDVSPVLGLCAPANSGKTSLLATLWTKLHERAAYGTRVVTAFYQFPKIDTRSTQRQVIADDPVITCLKCLAFQIAKVNNAYAQELKDVRDITNKKGPIVPKDSNYRECWDALRLSTAKIDLTCVLIIDGIEQLPRPEMGQELMELLAGQKTDAIAQQILVRSFVTGLAETFQDQIFYSIALTSFNEVDIKQYIDQELISDGAVAEFQKAHQEMFDAFKSGAIKDERDYTIIRSRVSRIKQAIEDYEPVDDIQEIMDRPLEGERKVVAQEIIDDFNDNLKDDDIKQLNEMLQWIIYGTRYCHFEDLEQALFVRGFKKESKYVKQKMSDKARYARMLETRNDGCIIPTSPEIETILRNMKRKTSTLEDSMGEDEPRITMDIKITNATRTTVRKFFWELNHRAIFDPTFFSQAEAVVETKTAIHINALDSHSMILCQCLDILTDEPQEDLRAISKWAVLAVPEHLRLGMQAEIDAGCPLPRRNEIVLGIISLLAEPQITVKHWQNLPWLEETWLDDPDPNISLNRWLRGGFSGFDSMDTLQPTDKRRLKKVLEASGENGWWYELTCTIGREWLLDEKWDARYAYGWVNGYIRMLERVAQEKAKAEAEAGEEGGGESGEQSEKKGGEENESSGGENAEQNEEVEAEDTKDENTGDNNGSQPEAVEPAEETDDAKPGEDEETSQETTVQTNGVNGVDEVKGDKSEDEAKEENSIETEAQANDTTDVKSEDAENPDETDTGDKTGDDTAGTNGDTAATENGVADAGEGGDDAPEEAKDEQAGGENAEEAPKTEDATLTKKQMIERAIEWLQKELKIDVLGALSLRRIGDIYLDEELYTDAVEAYKKALAMGKDVTKTRRSLSFAYQYLSEYQECINQMEKVLEAYKGGDAQPENDAETRENHYGLGVWYNRLKRPNMALTHLKESLTEEIDFNKYNEYLETLWRSKDEELTAEFLTKVHAPPEEGEADSHLVKFLLSSAMGGKQQFMDSSLVPLAKRLGIVREFAESLRIAREKMENATAGTVTPFDRLSLEVHEHMALLMLDRSATRVAICAKELGRCSSRLAASSFSKSWLHLKIANLSTQLYFELAAEHPDRAEHYIHQAEPTAKRIHELWTRGGNVQTGTFFVSHYTRSGRKEEAHEMILNHIKDAFDLLSDDDVTNDVDAYYSLGDLLLRIDDDNNALAAWSLVGPKEPEKKEEEETAPEINVTGTDDKMTLEVPAAKAEQPAELQGPLSYVCGGDCNNTNIKYANDFYICRFCPDVCFCRDCVAKVKDGSLERFLCHESHEFVHIPPWDEEWRQKVGKDNVVVGGTLQPGTWERIGGETIPITEWLDRLRKDWGIEKPPPPAEEGAEGGEKKEGEGEGEAGEANGANGVNGDAEKNGDANAGDATAAT